MSITSGKIISEATAERATYLTSHTAGQHIYSVTFDGSHYQHIEASNLPQARGLVRKALRQAFESPYNQALIFRGTLEPGEVSSTQFRAALRDVCEAHAKKAL